MAEELLHVRIISPQQLILETEATSVSSENSQGPFDILPEHANFITVIENTPIIVRPASRGEPPKEKPVTYTFPLSIIRVTANQVNIYTYIQPDLD